MANAVLVRYAGGWAERTDTSSITAHGRIEALLGLGAITSLAEVERVADGQLEDFAEPREQTDIRIDPRWSAETPYMGFQVGDTITVEGTSHRVLGLTISEDPDTERVEYVPTLNDHVVLNAQERIAQALTKMVRGTLSGRSKVAQPVVPAEKQRGRQNAGSGSSDSLWEDTGTELHPITDPQSFAVTTTSGTIYLTSANTIEMIADDVNITTSAVGGIDISANNGDLDLFADTDVYVASGANVTLDASSGGIFLFGIPTSDPGSPGQLYRDGSGFLKISI